MKSGSRKADRIYKMNWIEISNPQNLLILSNVPCSLDRRVAISLTH
jgi:hypothetical protein